MKLTSLAIIVSLFGITEVYGQVDEIKSASSDNSSKSNSNDGSVTYYNSDEDSDGWSFLFGGIVEWQSFKLRGDRERYPSMVSLEIMLQGAIKPSSYYIFWPRVRGNWGLFSTDFRMNYLIEEGVEGFQHIRTNDWQILQLNLITSRFFTFRVGTGIMKEAFNSKESFNETAFIMNVHAPDQSKQIGFEYRFAKDWDTGANPRREFTVQYQHEIFSKGDFHTYVTAGGVYQRYYNTVTVWGIQAGIIFRFF